MRKSIVQSIFLLAVFLFSASCMFSTSSTTVKGFVREQSGKPIADADITFGGTLRSCLETRQAKNKNDILPTKHTN